MSGSSFAARRARRGLKVASTWCDRLRAHTGLVVLIYHRVGSGSGLRVDLPEWLFEEQMSRISAGPGALSLDAALRALQKVPAAQGGAVVVTFDDGTADFVENALPIIVRYQIPVTLYLATDFVESGRSFPADGKPASWSALRDALSTGLVSIGSHTHTHLLLDRASPRQVVQELEQSVALIGDRLGVHAADFAYPKAILGSSFAQGEVRARFRSAAIAGTRPNPYGGSDPYRLARSPIQVDDGLRFFEHKLSGGLRLEDDVRRLLNRRRLAGRNT